MILAFEAIGCGKDVVCRTQWPFERHSAASFAGSRQILINRSTRERRVAAFAWMEEGASKLRLPPLPL